MSEEAKQKAAAGWYAHPSMAHTRRYWDGEGWTNHISPAESQVGRMRQKPESPAGLIIVGFVLGLIGGAVFVFAGVEGSSVGVFAGSVLMSLASMSAMVGIIAAGVRLGIEHGDYARQLRSSD